MNNNIVYNFIMYKILCMKQYDKCLLLIDKQFIIYYYIVSMQGYIIFFNRIICRVECFCNINYFGNELIMVDVFCLNVIQ